MKLMDYYSKLYQHFSVVELGKEIKVTLDQLAELFDCSKQNVRLLLKQMINKGWIQWVSGLGRGNTSVLRLLHKWDYILYVNAMDAIYEGNLDSALQRVQSVSTEYKEQFIQNVYDHLGYQVEIQKNREIDLLRFTTGSSFQILDPAYVFLAKDYNMVREIFDCLVRVNVETHEIEPHLAHYWESDEQGLIWTFYLRKHVLFHHGRELTARDILFTFQRILDPLVGSPYRWMFSEIIELKQVREHAIRITLASPNHFFLRFLSLPPASIIPFDLYQNPKENLAHYPMGTGPYKVVRNDQVMFTLEAFTNHFKGCPLLDRIEMWIFPHVSLSLVDHQNEKEASSLRLESPKTLLQYISFNLSKGGPLQNRRLREAICNAIDRRKMIQELGGNRNCVADGYFTKTNLFTQGEHNEKVNTFEDIEYCGEPIILYTFKRPELIADAEWIQAKCREVGIHIEIKSLRASQLIKSDVIREADLLLKGDFQEADEELNFLKAVLHDNSVIKLHMNHELSTTVEEFYKIIAAEPIQEERFKIMININELLKAHFSVLFLYDEKQVLQYPSYIKGIDGHARGLIDFHNLWFKKNE